MTITNESKPKRLYIYPKDVMRITGKGKKASYALIQKIKRQLNKDRKKCLTVLEFCQVQGLEIDEVNLYL
jgi:hypothetical protein